MIQRGANKGCILTYVAFPILFILIILGSEKIKRHT